MAKKKRSLFMTREEQDEIREKYGDWVADCIAFRGGGLDIDTTAEEIEEWFGKKETKGD